MSTTVMGACWPIQIPPTPKAVLMSLADNANDHGVCWPSIDTICTRTCLGRSTVIRAIKWLEDYGLLAAKRVSGASTRYQIVPNARAPQLFDANGDPSRSGTGVKAGRVSKRDGCQSGTRPGEVADPSRSGTQPVPERDPNRKEPSVDISISAGESLNEPPSNPDEFVQRADVVGSFEGHGNGPFIPQPAVPTPAGRIAVELRSRGYAVTSMDPDLLRAVEQGVTFAQVVELADLHPPDPAYRNSAAYVLLIACSQLQRAASPTATVSRGTPHGKRRESDPERIARINREHDEREAAATGGDAHAMAP